MSEFIPEIDESEKYDPNRSENKAVDKMNALKSTTDLVLEKLSEVPNAMSYMGDTTLDDILGSDDDEYDVVIDMINSFIDKEFIIYEKDYIKLSDIMNMVVGYTDILNMDINKHPDDPAVVIEIRDIIMKIFTRVFKDANLVAIPKLDCTEESLILSDVLLYRKESL